MKIASLSVHIIC